MERHPMVKIFIMLASLACLLTAEPAQALRFRPSAASRAGMANAAPGGKGSRLNGCAAPMPSIEYDIGHTGGRFPSKLPPPPIIIDKGIKVIENRP